MYEIIQQRSALSPEAYRIVENVLGHEAAHKTLYDDWEVVELPIEPMNFYFPVGDDP